MVDCQVPLRLVIKYFDYFRLYMEWMPVSALTALASMLLSFPRTVLKKYT